MCKSHLRKIIKNDGRPSYFSTVTVSSKGSMQREWVGLPEGCQGTFDGCWHIRQHGEASPTLHWSSTQSTSCQSSEETCWHADTRPGSRSTDRSHRTSSWTDTQHHDQQSTRHVQGQRPRPHTWCQHAAFRRIKAILLSSRLSENVNITPSIIRQVSSEERIA